MDGVKDREILGKNIKYAKYVKIGQKFIVQHGSDLKNKAKATMQLLAKKQSRCSGVA